MCICGGGGGYPVYTPYPVSRAFRRRRKDLSLPELIQDDAYSRFVFVRVDPEFGAVSSFTLTQEALCSCSV